MIEPGSCQSASGEKGGIGMIGSIGTTDRDRCQRRRQYRIEKSESGSSPGGSSSVELMWPSNFSASSSRNPATWSASASTSSSTVPEGRFLTHPVTGCLCAIERVV